MKQQIPDLIKKASRTWLIAAANLNVCVVAPFKIKIGPQSVECLAFLPDFGSSNGTIVGAMHPSKLTTDDRVLDYAKHNGMFCSFVNPMGWTEYDEAAFKEALEDWGYFGPLEKCPPWYRGYNYTQIGIMHRDLLGAWSEAARNLGVRMVTDMPPFTDRLTFIGQVPDFGSRNGMILGAIYPPKFDKDRELEDYAKQRQMFCSFLSVPDYADYDEGKYVEALSDWGYFGPRKKRPLWLAK